MTKTGRNDECPCGSGKKYKKCCIHRQAPITNLSSNKPDRVSRPKSGLDLQAIPYRMEQVGMEETFRIQLVDRVQELLASVDLFLPLGWDPARVEKFRILLSECSTTRMADFQLTIRDSASVMEIVRSGKASPKFPCSVLWNEIDQYIYYYRIETINLAQEILARIVKGFTDHVSLAMYVRQFLELALNACANQWVLTTAYNDLANCLNSARPGSVSAIFWRQLEEFVISLVCCSKSDRGQLVELLGRKSKLIDDKNYTNTSYGPSAHRQIEITKWVAQNFEKHTQYKGLVERVETVRRRYRYLCKFVHPSPLLFDVPCGESEYSVDDVIRSVQTCSIDVVENVLHIFVPMFMEKGYVIKSFQDLVEEFVYLQTEEPEAMIEVKDEHLLPAVLNNYRDIVLPTCDGPLPIYKRQSGRVEGLSDSFAKLALEQQDQILELVRKLENS